MFVDSSNKSRYLQHSTAIVTPSSDLPRRRRRRRVVVENNKQNVPFIKTIMDDNCLNGNVSKGGRYKNDDSNENLEKASNRAKPSTSLNESPRLERSKRVTESFNSLNGCASMPNSELIDSARMQSSTMSLSSSVGGNRRSFGLESFGSSSENEPPNHDIQSNIFDNQQNFYMTIPSTPERQTLRGDNSATSKIHRASSEPRFSGHLIWSVHMIVALIVIVVGYCKNQIPLPRKYVLLPQQNDECQKLFVNVFSLTATEADATICCENSVTRLFDQNDVQSYDMNSYHSLTLKSNVCGQIYSGAGKTTLVSVTRLPFATRLSKFPDALILPLFPILARLLYKLSMVILNAVIASYCCIGTSSIRQNHLNQRGAANNSSCYDTIDNNRSDEAKRLNGAITGVQTNSSFAAYGASASMSPTFSAKRPDCVYVGRRIALYISIMIFRGWILYVGLNDLEDNVVLPLIQTKNDEDCWYQSYFPADQSCRGRDFDFSDHMVLFYGQILPVSLFETIHTFRNPYWHQDNYYRSKTWPIILILSQVYLHMITSLGAYKTVSYFHTVGESCTGFAVGALLFIPLWWLQCSMSSLATKWRTFFFGIPS